MRPFFRFWWPNDAKYRRGPAIILDKSVGIGEGAECQQSITEENGLEVCDGKRSISSRHGLKNPMMKVERVRTQKTRGLSGDYIMRRGRWDHLGI